MAAGEKFSREYWDDEAQVLRVVWAPGSVCTGEAARMSTEAIGALALGPVPMLVDMREMQKLEREAREHFKVEKGGVCAMALLVGSPVTKMLANFFMRTDADRTPTRMFTSEPAAVAWLRSQRP